MFVAFAAPRPDRVVLLFVARLLAVTPADAPALRSSLAVDQLSGTISGAGVAVESLELREVGGGAVAGAVVHFAGTAFTISGFHPLGPARSYELLVKFASASTGAYTIALAARFSE